jgi:hypothetical protein
MRPAIVCSALALALSACSSTNVPLSPAAQLPPDVANGAGSQHGNYEMVPAGETRDAAGDRCYIYNWDRPLNKNYAIRYSSASCESKAHPIWMSTTPYVRSIVPLSQSNLGQATAYP